MFRRIMKAVLSLFLAVTTMSASVSSFLSLPRVPSKDKTVDMSKFTLVWSDEFDGTELDRDKWSYEWWITERKGGFWHEDMISVRDGNLVISAQYFDEPLENRYYDKWHDVIDFKPYRPGWYTGQVVTRDKYEQCYGYFECRCILPAATGLWSAFWMMNEGVYNVDGSGKDGTEVDVFESFYYKDHWWGADAISTGIHYDGYGDGHHGDSIGKWYLSGDPYKEYNTYGVEWNPDEYIFYINGHETGRLSTGGVSQNPEFLLLSVEFGGKDGVQSSDRTSTGKISKTPKENWPAEFVVDYVRCYQYNDLLPQIDPGEIIPK